MAELMVLFQALLLVAGWLLFLRAQTELRAQAARQSLTGELEALRQTLDALLARLIEESERAEERIQQLQRLMSIAPSAQSQHAESQHADLPPPETKPAPMETLNPDFGYNSTEQERPAAGAVVQLARQGFSIAEIARQTGYAPGEVELILNLKRRHLEEAE